MHHVKMWDMMYLIVSKVYFHLNTVIISYYVKSDASLHMPCMPS